MESGVSSSLNILFNKMENFVTTKTVVGEPITIGGVIILPLIDVSFGVGAGGALIRNDTEAKEKSDIDTNGGGLGAKITPSAVVVISSDGNVSTVNLKNQDSVSKLIDMVPTIVSKLNFGPFSKNKKGEDNKTEVKFEEKIFDENGKLVEKKSVEKQIYDDEV
ncbi:MAG: sporulation protein [Clostridiales bacterium]|nr:sporulation protein [Clostridiales bacterium]